VLRVQRNGVGHVLLLGHPRRDLLLRLEHGGAQLLIYACDHVLRSGREPGEAVVRNATHAHSCVSRRGG
jgi:hypothetical protein